MYRNYLPTNLKTFRNKIKSYTFPSTNVKRGKQQGDILAIINERK